MAEIKYQYAYDENQHLISINDITKENRNEHQYVCIGCGNPLLPRAIGSKCRRAHFYHKELVDCSGETYLHKLTKKIFREKFLNAEHFEVTYRVKKECDAFNCKFRNMLCVDEYSTTTIDLKEYYDTCEEEVSIKSFVADLLLTNSKNPQIPPILIEVCVSHACEPEKRNSGLKIIEMKIRNEDDIKELLDFNHLKEEYGWEYEHKKGGAVEFISFKRNLKEHMNVPIVRYVFAGDEHQAGYCTNVNCQKANYKIRKDSVCELNLIGIHEHVIGGELIALRWLCQHYNIRRCLVCKFYYKTMYEEFPICRLSKKYGKPEFPQMKDAENCSSFRLGNSNTAGELSPNHVTTTEIKDLSPENREQYRVIVAGSSGFRDYELFKEKCDYYLSSKLKTNDIVILVGTSRDTKEMIDTYCLERNITYEPYEADWIRYSNGAPQKCTETMLKHADAVIVFWDGESRYTQNLIYCANQKGLRVAVIHVNVEPGSQMYLNL